LNKEGIFCNIDKIVWIESSHHYKDIGGFILVNNAFLYLNRYDDCYAPNKSLQKKDGWEVYMEKYLLLMENRLTQDDELRSKMMNVAFEVHLH
jgi:hypothetical protein